MNKKFDNYCKRVLIEQGLGNMGFANRETSYLPDDVAQYIQYTVDKYGSVAIRDIVHKMGAEVSQLIEYVEAEDELDIAHEHGEPMFILKKELCK